mgnify:CR=1 FL=1
MPFLWPNIYAKNIQKHLARFVRIKRMNRISIQAVAEHRPETEKWLLAYDCYQIEIIELASIIEVLFRDYFEALLFISCESKKDSFLEKIVRKYTGNDFMNIEKQMISTKRHLELKYERI